MSVSSSKYRVICTEQNSLRQTPVASTNQVRLKRMTRQDGTATKADALSLNRLQDMFVASHGCWLTGLPIFCHFLLIQVLWKGVVRFFPILQSGRLQNILWQLLKLINLIKPLLQDSHYIFYNLEWICN